MNVLGVKHKIVEWFLWVLSVHYTLCFNHCMTSQYRLTEIIWPMLQVMWCMDEFRWPIIHVNLFSLHFSPSIWPSSLRAGVLSEGPQLDLDFSEVSVELWECLYRSKASLLHITKRPVAVDPISYLHMYCKYTHPVCWASVPQSPFWQHTHNTQYFGLNWWALSENTIFNWLTTEIFSVEVPLCL